MLTQYYNANTVPVVFLRAGFLYIALYSTRLGYLSCVADEHVKRILLNQRLRDLALSVLIENEEIKLNCIRYSEVVGVDAGMWQILNGVYN